MQALLQKRTGGQVLMKGKEQEKMDGGPVVNKRLDPLLAVV